MTVSCTGAARYADLFEVLEPHGLALQNLASLPHISVAGAIATATHGSGDASGNLATSVAAIDLVTSDGELRTFTRGDPDFAGVVVGLGSLGVVTRVVLDLVPSYDVRQDVYEGVTWTEFDASLDAIFASGDSVSAFTDWDASGPAQIWVKTRASDTQDLRDLVEARLATEDRHPIAGLDPANCTAQLGRPGPWWDRLPHFRAGFVPSSGDELQSEYLVPRTSAIDAIAAVRELAHVIGPVLQISEIRTIAADDLWMSPQFDADTIGIHFTWRKDGPAVRALLHELEPALAPFDVRPHWGKLFEARADRIAGLYPRHADFVRLIGRLDPRGAFRNAWLDRHVLGSSG
jgi:alditol oxidase